MTNSFRLLGSFALAVLVSVIILRTTAIAQAPGNGRGRLLNPKPGAAIDFTNPADALAFDQLRRQGRGNAGGKGGRGGRGGTPPPETHLDGHYEFIGGVWPDRIYGQTEMDDGVRDPLLDFDLYLKGFPPGAWKDIQAGFDVWWNEIDAVLYATNFSVDEISDAPSVFSRDGVNTVSMGNLGGSYLAITYYWWDDVDDDGVMDAGEEFLEADIVFSAQISWATRTEEGEDSANYPTNNRGKIEKFWWDLQSVASHEVGHVLGLDHSGDAHALDLVQTMYAIINTKDTEKQTLEPTGDIPGIRSSHLGYTAP